MGADNDIVVRLDSMARFYENQAAGSSRGPNCYAIRAELARDSAAEIVRLRGELALAAGWHDEAPAMPNGVEADWKCIISVLEHGVRDGIHGGYNASYIKQQIAALRAADNRDAAGVTDERGRPMTYWGGTPAAVPAGEAVAKPDWFCEDHPEHEMGHDGCNGCGILECARIPQLLHFIRMFRQELRERDQQYGFLAEMALNTPQPAGGEAVAFNYAVVHRFATENGVDYNRLAKLVRDSVYTTPPAPVQAAPQEGEDAAEAYRKAWEAGHAAACELVVDDAMVERVCRNHFPDWDMYGPAGKMVRSADIRRLLTAALQHRGDSQEVGRG